MIDSTLLAKLKTKAHLLEYLEQSKNDVPLYKDVLDKYYYEKLLLQLQAELVDFQKWVQKEEKKIAIVFEGRDASGKGGTIRRFAEHLNPRAMRIVALNKPTEIERKQWYFNRYIKELPNAGEIVFFDRSWYNRAVVEPVMDFCTPEQYERFMAQVPEFEHMLYESDTKIIKFWFSVTIDEQKTRFDNRLGNPLKKWKFSPVDQKGQDLWEDYTYYKNQMFARTHHAFCPWIIVKSNDKRLARIESIKFVLSQFDYEGKGSNCPDLLPDPNIVHRFFRQQIKI
ncbi:polyphosphate kinase 2 [uncultured Maribacter sp.]|uniref:polyphosphate kinase 2 n=1 Tax=uncultured Maribacter sp. TaxID=431308 RepID=UPI0030EC76AF|tara:strand:+ start:50375 stop:51223 length:849 start_codon:yes stop_codon:yes gene_type:complete